MSFFFFFFLSWSSKHKHNIASEVHTFNIKIENTTIYYTVLCITQGYTLWSLWYWEHSGLVGISLNKTGRQTETYLCKVAIDTYFQCAQMSSGLQVLILHSFWTIHNDIHMSHHTQPHTNLICMTLAFRFLYNVCYGGFNEAIFVFFQCLPELRKR